MKRLFRSYNVCPRCNNARDRLIEVCSHLSLPLATTSPGRLPLASLDNTVHIGICDRRLSILSGSLYLSAILESFLFPERTVSPFYKG